jgi:hypothetical protein
MILVGSCVTRIRIVRRQRPERLTDYSEHFRRIRVLEGRSHSSTQSD